MSEVLERYVEVYTAMARAEGREEGKAEFAFNLFKEGLTDFSKVSRLVGIDLDTVEELYKEYMSMA